MAEFGIFAGAVPVTDSIFKHVGEIVKFWKDVKHAPAKIEDLLEELETHSELLKYWTTSPHASSFQSSPGFAKCHKSCLRVQCLLKEVALKFRSKGMRRLRVEATWTAMKAVFNSGEIDDLIARMTRADQKLLMAIECYKHEQVQANLREDRAIAQRNQLLVLKNQDLLHQIQRHILQSAARDQQLVDSVLPQMADGIIQNITTISHDTQLSLGREIQRFTVESIQEGFGGLQQNMLTSEASTTALSTARSLPAGLSFAKLRAFMRIFGNSVLLRGQYFNVTVECVLPQGIDDDRALLGFDKYQGWIDTESFMFKVYSSVRSFKRTSFNMRTPTNGCQWQWCPEVATDKRAPMKPIGLPPLELQHSTIDERGFLSTKYLSGSDELSREICLKGADQSTAFDVVRTTLGSIASAPKAESITFLMFKFRFEKEQALFKGAQPFDQTSGQDEELEYSLKDNLEDGDDDSQSDEGNDEYEEEEEPGDILEDSLEDEPNDELPGDPEEDTVLGRILPEDDTVLGRIVERFSIRISVGSDRTGKSDIELDRDSFREGNHGDGFISEDDSDDEIGEDSDNIRRKVPYDRYDERSASDVKAAIRKLSREVNIFGGDLSCALAKDCKAELEWEWYEGDDRCYERRNIVSYADDD